ncbi:unnamed protein product [Sphenostylis stenocarpa]|uniref:Chaoptin n=1 Tax=Sphenostylis stenocarpa TaxID=92480 RepID=A0AA86VPH8_9FABA|nr:unnamed protein product [Sphenostylis stenocarpa]
MEKNRKDFVYIDLSKNRFEGEIPNVIGELFAMRGLNLSHNRFSGHIPQSLGYLTNLESLDLSSNMLNECSKDPGQHSPPSLTFKREQGFGFGWKPVAIGYGCGIILEWEWDVVCC